MINVRRGRPVICIVLILTLCTPALFAGEILENSGVQISYDERGAGEPIILLHGFSQTLHMWEEIGVAQSLARDHRVISVDLRGHGSSGKPHAPEDYGPKMGEDVIRLLDYLGIEKAHLIGFSMGSTIASRLLITHPNRVSTATLGSGYFPHWDEVEEDYARCTENRATTGERFPWEPPNQDLFALAAAIRGFRYMPVSDDDIAGISIPTVFVFGSLELEEFSSEDVRRWNNMPNSVRRVVIEGADHDEHRPAILEPAFLEAAIALIEGQTK